MKAIALILALVALTQNFTPSTAHRSDDCDERRGPPGPPGPPGPSNPVVYGEFIRPFTFAPSLPIVQPGGALVFPVPTVPPVGVIYVDNPGQVGLLVPAGVYEVAWVANPSVNASLTLLVNGVAPTTPSSPSYPYTQLLTTGPVDVEYLIWAPLPMNLLSLVNSGSQLFTLSSIPNTAIGATSFLTQIRVKRIGPA